MKFGVLSILFSTALLTGDVECGILRSIFGPGDPDPNRVTLPEVSRALSNDDVAVLDTVGLVRQYGYPVERHNVTTEDGYEIVFFRMPGTPELPPAIGKPVVFLQHGMISSSDSWVLIGPTKDLAFVLAEAGYDVWLGNTRGNNYGRSHRYMDPTNATFWNYSYHEHALIDLPTMIDYVLNITEEQTMFYVGHSMGTTMSYVLLSERPEYNDIIRLVVSLAPAALWKERPRGAIGLIVDYYPLVQAVLDGGGINEIAPQANFNMMVARTLCHKQSFTKNLCADMFFTLVGRDYAQLNTSILPYLFSYYPAGSSKKVLYHFAQNIETGTFQKYDLGVTANMNVYGTKKPPIYNVKKISAPVALIYGKNDPISLKINVEELAKKLEKVVTMEPVPFDLFNHQDFIWAINARVLVYNRVLELISMYKN